MTSGSSIHPDRASIFGQRSLLATVREAAPSDSDSSEAGSAVLDALTAEAQARFGSSVVGVLFYGSVLRDRLSSEDALFDMMVVVDSYRSAYRRWLPALANWLLAPNVYYVESTRHGAKARAKYAVVSQSQLKYLTSTRSFQNYFWGRLCQPSVIHWARDKGARNALAASLWQAVETIVRTTSPLMREPFTSEAFWTRGLQESYRTEFRPERNSRAETLSASARMRNEAICRELAPSLGWTLNGDMWTPSTPAPLRWLAQMSWFFRRFQGRVLHLLRLAKAAFTFDQGIDYLTWKIERHTGAEVQLSERVRKHPLIFGWWAIWRLKRKGSLR